MDFFAICILAGAVLANISILRSFLKKMGIKVMGGISNQVLPSGTKREGAKTLDKKPLQNPEVENNQNPSGSMPHMQVPSVQTPGAQMPGAQMPGGAVGMLGVLNVVGAVAQTGGKVTNAFMAQRQITGPIYQGANVVYNTKLKGSKKLQQQAGNILNQTNKGKVAIAQGRGNNTFTKGTIKINANSTETNRIYGNVKRIKSNNGRIFTKVLKITGISKAQTLVAKKFVANKTTREKIQRIAASGVGYPQEKRATRYIMASNNRSMPAIGGQQQSGSYNITNQNQETNQNISNVRQESSTIINNQQQSNINSLNQSSQQILQRVDTQNINNLNQATNQNINNILQGNGLAIGTSNRPANIWIGQINVLKISGYRNGTNERYVAETPQQQLAMLVRKDVFSDKSNNVLNFAQRCELSCITEAQKGSMTLVNGGVGERDSQYQKELIREIMQIAPDLRPEDKIRVFNNALQIGEKRRRNNEAIQHAVATEKVSQRFNVGEKIKGAVDEVINENSNINNIFYNYINSNYEKDITLSGDKIKEIEQQARENIEARKGISLEEKEKEYKKLKDEMILQVVKERREDIIKMVKEEMATDVSKAEGIIGSEGLELLKGKIEGIERERKNLYEKILNMQKRLTTNSYAEYKNRKKEEMRQDIINAIDDLNSQSAPIIPFMSRMAQENEANRQDVV